VARAWHSGDLGSYGGDDLFALGVGHSGLYGVRLL
jgi:hypothetical protein